MTPPPTDPDRLIPDDSRAEDASDTVLGGRVVVVGMVLFGVVMVSGMWLYWHLYTRPFRSLQVAIHAEFPDSIPRVVGGRHKSHKEDTESVLRIVLDVEFNPETAAADALTQRIDRIQALAAEHMDLSAYDELEVHLMQRVPEAETRSRSFQFPLTED